MQITQRRIHIFSKTKRSIISENDKLCPYISFKEGDFYFFIVIVSLKFDFNKLYFTHFSNDYSKKSNS
jgi:hypothetical protein